METSACCKQSHPAVALKTLAICRRWNVSDGFHERCALYFPDLADHVLFQPGRLQHGASWFTGGEVQRRQFFRQQVFPNLAVLLWLSGISAEQRNQLWFLFGSHDSAPDHRHYSPAAA